MSCNRMSRFVLRCLQARPCNLLCLDVTSSSGNSHLLSCSHNFMTNNAHKRSNYSHLSSGQYSATAARSFSPASQSKSKELLLSYPASTNPLLVIQWRGLRGYPSHRTDKQSLGRETRKNAELSRTDKQSMATDLKGGVPPNPEVPGPEPEATQSLTLYQRFRKTYKEHGKVLVAVHLVTSAAWFGSFYTLSRCGFDIVPYLENWNFSEKLISPFRSGGLGDLALAYLLYKLATPARYTVTIGGTNLAIRYLRREGKIPLVPKEDSIRSLYKEGKEDLQRRSIKRFNKRNKNKQNGTIPKDKP